MADTLVSFDEFIGQKNLKRQLRLAIQSARKRAARLEHILLVGPPGFGKTSLARIIANEMYHDFESFFMPVEPKIMQQLMAEYSGVVLLDEIHRAPPKQQEMLLTVLGEGYFQTKNGMRIPNDTITFVAATTEGDKIVDAVRDRFPLRPIFDPYTDEDMAQIIMQMAVNASVEISRKAAYRLGRATLGVPRTGKMIVNTWRDLHLEGGQVDVGRVLASLRLTDTGLTAEHIRYCEYLAKAGGQAGLDLMKQLLSMPAGAVERLEIDLIKQGILERQSTGRTLTGKGFELVGINRFGSRNRRT